MSSPQRLRFIQRASIAVACVLGVGAVGLGGYNLASAEVAEGDRPVFIPINPCRLLDTRPAAAVGPVARPLGPQETLTVSAHGSNGECTNASSIPTDAVGLSMNITAVGATAQTFLTFWGEGQNPGTSSLNPAPGQPPIPNAVNTPLSSTGSFQLYNDAGNVAVIADVNGYYATHNHDDRYLTEAQANNAFITETQADNTYLTATVADDTYITRNELGDTDFLASGTVNEAGTAVAAFTSPDGVTASVSKAGTGAYSLTLSGLSEAIDGVVLVTPIGDDSPGMGTAARGCAIGATSSNASSFSVDIGCYGENDGAAGNIIAEDSPFQFLIIG